MFEEDIERNRWSKIRDEIAAPRGKFRVVRVDKYQPPGEGHTIIGDYNSFEKAVKVRRGKKSTTTYPVYIYDAQGNELSQTLTDKRDQETNDEVIFVNSGLKALNHSSDMFSSLLGSLGNFLVATFRRNRKI